VEVGEGGCWRDFGASAKPKSNPRALLGSFVVIGGGLGVEKRMEDVVDV